MKIRKLSESKQAFMVLGAIIAFHFVNNYIWLKLSLPFPHSYAFEFSYVILFYDYLINLQLRDIINLFVMGHDVFIHSFTAALIAVLFGKSLPIITLLNNMPYFIIAVVSIYLLGERFADRRTGLFAAGIFSFYPAVFGISRMYVQEFAVMGIVPLAVWCLLKTDGFADRNYSLMAGLVFAWGMMLKYSFIVFIAGPLIYELSLSLACVLKGHKAGKKEHRQVFFNMGIFIFASIAPIGIKYFNPQSLRGFFLRLFFQPAHNWQVYTSGMIEFQLSLFFFLLFAVGTISFLLKTHKKTQLILLSWMLIPWTILVAMPHVKVTHLIIPYLPAIALITAIGLVKLLNSKKILMRTLFILTAMAALFQYYDLSFGLGVDFHKYKFSIAEKTIHFYVPREGICRQPRQFVGGYDKIIAAIAKRAGKASSRVLFIPDSQGFYTSSSVWDVMPWFRSLPFEVNICDQTPGFFRNLKIFDEVDFILYSGYLDLKRDHDYLDWLMHALVEAKFEFLFHHPDLTEDSFRGPGPELKDQFKESLSNFKLVDVLLEKKDGLKLFLYSRGERGGR